MKRLVLLSVATLLATTVLNAQNKCGTHTYNQQLLQQNPEFVKSRAKIESMTQKIIQQNPNYKVGSIVTIPVVVHVVWKTAAQNIPDAKIFSQIDQLNDDFARLNSDTNNTPSAFLPVAANTQIQFCLAQRDPSGAATTGIVRVQTTANSFGQNDAIKYTAQGGSDAWPAGEYLNFWVGNLSGGLLGYAQFPGQNPNTDGVVILYNSVGSIANPGAGGAPYNLGRTATHEIGHWLNLYHINGDSNCGDDLVFDTPEQDALHGGCPNAPYHTNTCGAGTSPNGEMFMNYMDYTDDACMNIFTLGQSSRMNSALSGPRSSILTSMGCVPPTTAQNDAGISAIAAPSGNYCATSVTPDVTIKNYGIAALTSATINYQIDAGTVNTFAWTGNLAQGATTNVTLPAITGITSGAHTFNCYTTNPNATTDADASNDGSISNFNIATVGAALPYQEGFEPPAFPPTSWVIDNPDASYTWVRTTTAAKTGVASMFIENFNYQANGEMDEAIMPAFDLTSVANPGLTFQVAYAYYTNPLQYSDTLEVLISTDCGLTYSSIYKKWAPALATTATGWTTNSFVPTSSQWRLETISLTPYSSSNNAIIKFRNITDYENNLYLDDINIINATSLNQLDANTYFSLSPNPSNGKFNLVVGQTEVRAVDLTVYNVVGQKVYERDFTGSKINQSVDLTHLGKGIYNALITISGKTKSQKLVIE